MSLGNCARLALSSSVRRSDRIFKTENEEKKT
jgi:hypothetical protein